MQDKILGRTEQLQELLEMLGSEKPNECITVIQVLGEIGDEDALKTLRQRMAVVNRELQALVIAVGKLKRRLGVK